MVNKSQEYESCDQLTIKTSYFIVQQHPGYYVVLPLGSAWSEYEKGGGLWWMEEEE